MILEMENWKFAVYSDEVIQKERIPVEWFFFHSSVVRTLDYYFRRPGIWFWKCFYYVLIPNKWNSKRDIWKWEFLTKSNYARLHLTSVWYICSTAIDYPSARPPIAAKNLKWHDCKANNSIPVEVPESAFLRIPLFWRLLCGTLISLRVFPTVSRTTTRHFNEAPS